MFQDIKLHSITPFIHKWFDGVDFFFVCLDTYYYIFLKCIPWFTIFT